MLAINGGEQGPLSTVNANAEGIRVEHGSRVASGHHLGRHPSEARALRVATAEAPRGVVEGFIKGVRHAA